MDYLDPKKEFRHRVILFTGYILLAIAIVLTGIVLVYLANGFGFKDGAVTQNGLTFFSSQPNPAKIYANGVLQKVTTNSRLVLPAGKYHMKLTRDGYFDWQRTIELDGGSVEHFDYPLLIPKSLVTKALPKTYAVAPSFTTQSPDHRWLLVQQSGNLTEFDVYDLKNPTKPPVSLSLPASLLSKAQTTESWQLGEWADDNQHLVLQHIYDDKTEFILVDRQLAAQSLNLNTVLTVNPTKLTLVDRKYDRYYLYDQSSGVLQTASLKTPALTPLLTRVLAYHSYSDDTLLYVTNASSPAGTVEVRLKTGIQTSLIRSLPANTDYLLDLTKYSGTMYVAAGAASQNKVYIYRDPVGQLAAQPKHAVTPAQVLHVENPNYLSFSSNAQFIVTENGSRFGVYDIENKTGYNYTARASLDTPQLHASWMDGNRLFYVSGGKLVIFDYDNTNIHTLMATSADYSPAFAPNYKDVYGLINNSATNQFELTQTSLLIPQDR